MNTSNDCPFSAYLPAICFFIWIYIIRIIWIYIIRIIFLYSLDK